MCFVLNSIKLLILFRTSVSRSLRGFGGEPGRPADWFSPKSCAVQYNNLLTQIEMPKQKKRGADGSKSEGQDLAPADVIVRQLIIGKLLLELSLFCCLAMSEALKAMYCYFLFLNLQREELCMMSIQERRKNVEDGQAYDRLEEMSSQIHE